MSLPRIRGGLKPALELVWEREREIDFTPACGHMAAASEATCRSVYTASIFRLVMTFLSKKRQDNVCTYMGLSLPRMYV